MPSTHSIGVILPTHQSARYIAKALDSIFAQTRLPKEILISDDRSCDETEDIVRSVAAVAPVPVRFVVNDSPLGITENYLNALRHISSCEYIAVADHDDAWLPHRLQTLLDAFQQNPGATLVCCDSLLADDQLNPTGGTVRGGLARSERMCRQHRRMGSFSSFLKGGLPCLAHTLAFPFSLRPVLARKPSTIPNWYFEEWLTSVAACYGDLVLIPEALTLYRRHPKQATWSSKQSAIAATPTSKVFLPKAGSESRLQKLNYCHCILQTRESSTAEHSDVFNKRNQLDEACCFLSIRLAIHEPSTHFIARLRAMYKICLSGSYWRYASGMRSVCKDLVLIANSLCRG